MSGYTICPCCGHFETIDGDLCAYCEESGCEPDGSAPGDGCPQFEDPGYNDTELA